MDWKQTLYGAKTENKQELAKDVAGLANAEGGILILGVAERDSAAYASTPVELSADETERMQKICQFTIRPFLPGVRIIPIPLSPQTHTGYYVVAVPRSPDAPHAVVRGGNDNGDGTLLSYPIRDGQTTRYLHEPEIARRYRDRFTSRQERTAALERIRAEGERRTPAGTGWLMVSLFPSALGTHHSVGSASIARITENVSGWVDTVPPLPSMIFQDAVHGFPGLRRAVVTTTSDARAVLHDDYTELHLNGAGFAAIPDDAIQPDDPKADRPGFAQDRLELGLLSMVSLLAHHAAASGAGGDCELLAQLRIPAFDVNVRIVKPASLYAPASRFRNGTPDSHLEVRNSVPVTEQPQLVRVSASLDELTESPRAVVQTAHALAVDIISQFAVADTCIVRADGELAATNALHWQQDSIAAWLPAQLTI
ncbi:AlbA family DNA-binding domain-containing protein [Nocardia pseudovaccinii]|uniref:AlbA family DNA-binding domain-containing protein n=1 Tax=Nocardia pseudovaccinii TaxID=189540 RepID=UPI003D90C718